MFIGLLYEYYVGHCMFWEINFIRENRYKSSAIEGGSVLLMCSVLCPAVII